MEENQKSLIRALLTLTALFSSIIHSVVFTAVFYILMSLTWMEMDTASLSNSFIFVAVVTVLVPITFLVGFAGTLLYEVALRWLPKRLFYLLIKVFEVIALWKITNWVDCYMDGVQLSETAQLIFAYTIYVLTDYWVSRGKRGNKKKEQEG